MQNSSLIISSVMIALLDSVVVSGSGRLFGCWCGWRGHEFW